MAITAKVERIIHEVEALSAEEREELMGALELSDEIALSGDWRDELDRRAREIDDGKVQLVDEEEFLRKLRTV